MADKKTLAIILFGVLLVSSFQLIQGQFWGGPFGGSSYLNTGFSNQAAITNSAGQNIALSTGYPGVSWGLGFPVGETGISYGLGGFPAGGAGIGAWPVGGFGLGGYSAFNGLGFGGYPLIGNGYGVTINTNGFPIGGSALPITGSAAPTIGFNTPITGSTAPITGNTAPITGAAANNGTNNIMNPLNMSNLFNNISSMLPNMTQPNMTQPNMTQPNMTMPNMNIPQMNLAAPTANKRRW